MQPAADQQHLVLVVDDDPLVTEFVKAAMEAGVVGYVLKPFSAADLPAQARAATKNQSRVWL
ncbi:hypothetical protein AS593_18520 [Caulobacter vibrioides]|nr:hypothetical protein AS593_18520 [Caulobacter vibrioides]